MPGRCEVAGQRGSIRRSGVSEFLAPVSSRRSGDSALRAASSSRRRPVFASTHALRHRRRAGPGFRVVCPPGVPGESDCRVHTRNRRTGVSHIRVDRRSRRTERFGSRGGHRSICRTGLGFRDRTESRRQVDPGTRAARRRFHLPGCTPEPPDPRFGSRARNPGAPVRKTRLPVRKCLAERPGVRPRTISGNIRVIPDGSPSSVRPSIDRRIWPGSCPAQL